MGSESNVGAPGANPSEPRLLGVSGVEMDTPYSEDEIAHAMAFSTECLKAGHQFVHAMGGTGRQMQLGMLALAHTIGVMRAIVSRWHGIDAGLLDRLVREGVERGAADYRDALREKTGPAS